MLIYALDGLDQIGQITHWSELKVTERDLDVGSWAIEVPLDGADAGVVEQWLDRDVLSGLEVHDPTTGWRFGGPAIIRDYEVTADGATAKLRGVDYMALLARRIYYFSADIYEIYKSIVIAGYATSVLHNMADTEMVLDDPDPLAYRKVPELSGVGEDNPLGGGIVNYQVNAGTTLLEIARSVLAGLDYTCRMRLDRRVDGSGAEVSSIRFSTPAREKANSLLSIENGGYEKATVTNTLAPSTMTIAVGAVPSWKPPTDPRNVTWARRPPTQAGYTLYGEQYLDLDGLQQAELQTEFYSAHIEAAARETAKFEGVDVAGWGRDVDLGWYVAAEVGVGGRTRLLDLPVGAFELSGPAGKLTKKIHVGDYEPEGVVKMLELLRGANRRLARLERG